MHDPVTFLSEIVILLAMPGPTNTLLATAGAMLGGRKALFFPIIETFAYLISISIFGALLNPLLTYAPISVVFIRIIAAIYLTFIAIKLWIHNQNRDHGAVGARRLFFATLSNPKAVIISMLMQPLGGAGLGTLFLVLLVAIPTMGCLWVGVGAFVGRAMDTTDNRRMVPRIAAVAIMAFTAILVIPVFSLHG